MIYYSGQYCNKDRQDYAEDNKKGLILFSERKRYLIEKACPTSEDISMQEEKDHEFDKIKQALDQRPIRIPDLNTKDEE